VDTDDLAGLTLGDVPDGPVKDRLQDRRRELGLSYDEHAALLIDPDTGAAVAAADLPRHLGRARLTRVSQEANAGVCRGMLQARYGPTPTGSILPIVPSAATQEENAS
jgi:hypothetical protein